MAMAAKNTSTMLTQVFPVALLAVLLLGPAGPGARAQELRLVPDGDVFDCVDFAVDLVLVDAGEPVFGYQVSLSFPAGSFEPRRFEAENQDWSVRRSGRFPFAPASPCEPWADGDATDRILIAATVYPDPGMVDRPVADAAEGVELVLGRIIFRSMRGSAGGVLSASASDCAGSPVSFPTAFFNADGQTRTVHSEALVVPVLRTEVEDLSCSIAESVVELRWSAQPALESVRIDRDGETIATASATAGLHLDEPGPGLHRYDIIGILSDGREACAVSCTAEVIFAVEDVAFLRGDADGSGGVNLTDGIQILRYLYQAGPMDCLDAADANDSGAVEIADAIFLLNYIFQSGEAIPPPHPAAGTDPTPDALDCGPAA